MTPSFLHHLAHPGSWCGPQLPYESQLPVPLYRVPAGWSNWVGLSPHQWGRPHLLPHHGDNSQVCWGSSHWGLLVPTALLFWPHCFFHLLVKWEDGWVNTDECVTQTGREQTKVKVSIGFKFTRENFSCRLVCERVFRSGNDLHGLWNPEFVKALFWSSLGKRKLPSEANFTKSLNTCKDMQRNPEHMQGSHLPAPVKL